MCVSHLADSLLLKLLMILQDPVVFSGTVRDNLDPFGASAGDGAIWAALRQTGMADTVTHLVSCAWQCSDQAFPMNSFLLCFVWLFGYKLQHKVAWAWVLDLSVCAP